MLKIFGWPVRRHAAALVVLGAALGVPLAASRAQPSGAEAGAASPAWFAAVLEQALRVPIAAGLPPPIAAGPPPVIPRLGYDRDISGAVGTFQPAGPTWVAGHAFFQPLGTNGRSCFSCHRPADGFSLSTTTLRALRDIGGDRDPVFAPVDGADCPSQPHNHSLLLGRGLFRIFLPIPAGADFTLKLLHDPNGCNTLPAYASTVDRATGQRRRMVSVYRRPLGTTNLAFVTSTNGTPVDPLTGRKLPTDPTTGEMESGNVMWDGREPTLESQALHAILGHAQAKTAPTSAQLAQIVAFEKRLFTAQALDAGAGFLDAGGAAGGPVKLASEPHGPNSATDFALYTAWGSLTGERPIDRRRRAIARGEAIFNGRFFAINDVAGLTNVPNLPNPFRGTCASCHNANHAGADAFPTAQRAIGVGGDQERLHGPAPSRDLPIFEITCKPGAVTAFGATTFVTNDPGKALISGKCADVGRRTVPPLRALAARAPYFSDGSAATLGDVVHFYNARFGIGLSRQDQADLVSFLAAL